MKLHWMPNHSVSVVRQAALVLTVAVVLTLQSIGAQERSVLRSELERALPAIESRYREAPGVPERRREFAQALVELGNMWEANDVIAPVATSWSDQAEDLELGARLASMLSDYERAERLYRRLREISTVGSEMHTKAISGLGLVFYQTDRYVEARELELPEGSKFNTLLTFMQKFEGEPYQIEWSNEEKIARLKMINPFRAPGALPLMRLEINGHEVEFILDTGGDRLYIDREVADRIGIRQIHERQARYAYTGGKTVTEPLGVADTVKLGEVSLKNVPVVCATWKSLGAMGDGVVTTQILKQFLSTVDYDKGEITLRERSEGGYDQWRASIGDQPLHRMPFFLSGTHLMFTKGSLNGRQGLNMFMDSGLATNMPLVIHEETVEDLGLEQAPLEGTKYFTATFDSHGIGSLTRGPAQGLGNVMVEENAYRRWGFLFDALISHQYLYHLGSWTIDFESMSYYFPTDPGPVAEVEAEIAEPETDQRVAIELTDAEASRYVGKYHSDVIASDIEITSDGNQLRMNASGNLRGSFSLVCVGDHRFEVENLPQKMVLEFEIESDVAKKVGLTVGVQGPFPFSRQ